jgi:hypothetical protein
MFSKGRFSKLGRKNKEETNLKRSDPEIQSKVNELVRFVTENK